MDSSIPDPVRIHVVGGGTTFTIRPHLELSAKAYGGTARRIAKLCEERWGDLGSVIVHMTKMASSGRGSMETNEDVGRLLKSVVEDPLSRVVFMPAALCDFTGSVIDGSISTTSGSRELRLKSADGQQMLLLTPAPKLIGDVRKYRKDVFLVGFKVTTSASDDEQYLAGLDLLKRSSCNLVLANDVHTGLNMVVTPEQARYHVTRDRDEALRGLVDMAFLRSRLRFTRSTVVLGERVGWDSQDVPESLRKVVDHCVRRGAYKPFLGSTNGHFAAKMPDGSFLTSVRKTDFNQIQSVGLVRVEPDGEDRVVAYGRRPSVGGQSQRQIFSRFPEADCIVHMHVPKRPGSSVPVRSQREFECGSHECGQNTSSGMEKFGNLWAVMLDQHGPNLAFHRSVNPHEVIAFIEENFDLTGRTDGMAASPDP